MLTLINPRNQGGLRYLFDLVDPQSNPERIDMGAIQPVIDMNFSGYAKLNDYDKLEDCEEPSSSIAGVQTKTWRILSYGNDDGSGDTQLVVPVGHNFIVWGIKMHIYFNAAGAAAFSGKYISSEVLAIMPTGAEVTKWHGTGHVSSGCLLYAPGHYEFAPLTRNELCIIPAGTVLNLVWWAQDGSNFPGTTVVRYAIVGQAVPEGAPLYGNV